MVCHHCGCRYIEFFPNARQENLFIGMIHAFSVLGVPKRVITDNMKSVRIGTDALGHPIFNKEYDEFQQAIGFKTTLCKVAHPYTKGAVERLVEYVKQNFIQARTFFNISDLNRQTLDWCNDKNHKPLRDYDFISAEEHLLEPMSKLPDFNVLIPYIAPIRSISFDGFVSYEGRKFGVPLSYLGHKVRVMRKLQELIIMDLNTGVVIQKHTVDWSKAVELAAGQWNSEYGNQPKELPTAPVKVSLQQLPNPVTGRFDRFKPLNKEEKNNG